MLRWPTGLAAAVLVGGVVLDVKPIAIAAAVLCLLVCVTLDVSSWIRWRRTATS